MKKSSWYHQHKERAKELSRQRYLRIKDTPEYKALKRKNAKAWYRKQRIKITAQRKALRDQARLEVMELLGGAFCKSCGYDDLRALQFDHIKGNGRIDRKKTGYNPYSILKRVRSSPHEFQVLCANCNSIKRVENIETFWDYYKENDQNFDRMAAYQARIAEYQSL